MRAKEFIHEALKPSQYRQMVKGWDSSRLAEIFQQWPGQKNRTATRLYIDLPATQTVLPPNPQVSNKLQQLGYEVVDYTRGLARKKDGNQNPTKIGKILSAAVQRGDSEANTALQQFQNDPNRSATRTEYRGVLSRHPYDIAGMSTDRGWTSCQDLVSGSECKYVPKDIKAGTLVAYMIKKDDVDIKSPVGRMLLKPYINDKNQTAYARHNETFGSVTEEFKKAVNQFAVWINKQTGVRGGPFTIDPEVYADDEHQMVVVDPNATKSELIEILKKDGENIKFILDAGIRPDEDLQVAAVLNDSDAILTLARAGFEPSERVQRAAIKHSAGAMRWIVDKDYIGVIPSEAVQLAAVNKNGRIIFFILTAGIKPSEAVQLAAVKRDEDYRTEFDWDPIIQKIIDAGIKPSEAVQVAAVKRDVRNMRHLLMADIEPSKKVLAAARANRRPR